jgi:Fe-S-cluster containining protein
VSGHAWYQGGLRFGCTRCGNCCTGAPGTVRVDASEEAALAAHLALDLATFRERCTRRLEDGATSLVEKANFECVFWDRARGCTVYAARPKQCRTWPFWRANLASPAHWAAAAHSCPGMDRGELHPAAAIAACAADDGTSGAVQELAELGLEPGADSDPGAVSAWRRETR